MLDTSARYYMKIQDELGENKEMDKTEKFYSLYEVLKLYDIKRSGNGSVYENDADVRKLLISRWKKACNMFLPKMYADYLLKDSDSVQRGKYDRFTESEKDFFIGKGQILRPTPNTAPLICGACYNTQPEDLLTMA